MNITSILLSLLEIAANVELEKSVLSSAIEEISHPHSFINIIFDDSRAAKDVLTSLLTQKSSEFSVNVENLKRKLHPKHGYFVLMVFGFAESMNTFKMNIESFKRNGFYLVFLSDGLPVDSEVFNFLWEKNFFNVFIIARDDERSYNLSTFMPFGKQKCGDTSPKTINQFKALKWTQRFEIPKKFKNMFGCKIVHGASVSTVVKTSNGSSTGIEIEIIDFIGGILNFKPIHKVSKSKGVVDANGKGKGILKDIYDRKVDITTGSLQPDRMQAFSESYPLISDPLVLIIPPGAHFTPLEKLYKNFSLFVWIAICFVLVVSILLVKLIPKRFEVLLVQRNWTKTIFDSFLGGSIAVNQLPIQHSTRFGFTMFLIFSLVIRTVYVGKLFIYLESDARHNDVESVDDMMERNFTFYAYETMMDRIVDFKFFNR